jgi:hypothetical protein
MKLQFGRKLLGHIFIPKFWIKLYPKTKDIFFSNYNEEVIGIAGNVYIFSDYNEEVIGIAGKVY